MKHKTMAEKKNTSCWTGYRQKDWKKGKYGTKVKNCVPCNKKK
jgi:hypothetical protein